MNHGDGRAPVALAGDEPVAEAVAYRPLAPAFFLHKIGDCLDALFAGLAVKLSRIDHSARFDIGFFEVLAVPVGGRHHHPDGEVILPGEGEVALVVGGHPHHRARAVAQEHVVGNPDGHLFAVEAVGAVSADKDAVFFSFGGEPFYLGLAAGLGDIVFDLGFFIGRGQLCHQRVLGSQDHKGDAEGGVGAGGEDPYLFFGGGGVVEAKRYLGAGALAHPVALHYFNALGPVDAVELHKLIGVFGDAEKPLLQIALDDGRPAALAGALADHLLVSQHRLALGAPVDLSLAPVSQPVLI